MNLLAWGLHLVHRLWPETAQQGLGATKVRKDLAWTTTAFLFLGLGNLLLNLMIGRLYDVTTLGLFVQVFALAVFLSQLTAFGVPVSVFNHLARGHLAAPEAATAVWAASILVGGVAGLGCLAGALLTGELSSLFASPGFGIAWQAALPGWWAFSLNRVLMAVLNAERRLQPLALLQASRYAAMVGLLPVAFAWGVPGPWLTLVFSLTEWGVLVALLLLHRHHLLTPPLPNRLRPWMSAHASFGGRGLVTDALTELVPRVHILMLGLLAEASAVGVFVIAAFFADGMLQLSVVLRNNLTPVLARQLAAGEYEAFHRTVRGAGRLAQAGALAIAVVTILLYPVAIGWVLPDPRFAAGWAPLAWMMVGLVASYGDLLLWMLPFLIGRPGLGSLINLGLVGCAAGLDALLIPWFGLQGAAIGASLCYLLAAVALRQVMLLLPTLATTPGPHP